MPAIMINGGQECSDSSRVVAQLMNGWYVDRPEIGPLGEIWRGPPYWANAYRILMQRGRSTSLNSRLIFSVHSLLAICFQSSFPHIQIDKAEALVVTTVHRKFRVQSS